MKIATLDGNDVCGEATKKMSIINRIPRDHSKCLIQSHAYNKHTRRMFLDLGPIKLHLSRFRIVNAYLWLLYQCNNMRQVQLSLNTLKI